MATSDLVDFREPRPTYQPYADAKVAAPTAYPYRFPKYYSLGKTYQGLCRDIDQLIVNWDRYFPNLVQLTTEDNYDSRPLDIVPRPRRTSRRRT